MSARERIDPREVIDDLTMMLTTPLLAGLDATSRLDLVEMQESDLWMSLSGGEQATLLIAAALESVRILLPKLDDRLAVLAAEALTALADEAQR